MRVFYFQGLLKELIVDNHNAPLQTPECTGSPKANTVHQVWVWFWRLFPVLSLAYAWYCFYVPANQIAWADNFANAQEQATGSQKQIILFFTGDWCVPCRIMKRNVWADDQVTAIVNKSFIPVSIDVDLPENSELADRYNIGGTPITLVVDAQGDALGWRVGGIDKAQFLDLIQNPNPPTADQD